MVPRLGQKDPLEKGRAAHSSVLGLLWRLRQQRVHLQCRRPGFNPWVGKIPQRRAWKPTPVLVPGEPHGQRSLVNLSPWGHRESDTAEQLALSTTPLFLLSALVLMPGTQ